MPFVSPVDVQLDRDNRTMVQPDVLLVCDRSRITRARIVGAPDFVVEIVSERHVVTDVLIKLGKYKMAGVREYWIVFPAERVVLAYRFERSDTPDLYSFEDEIPVEVLDGGCRIRFSEISRLIEDIYPDSPREPSPQHLTTIVVPTPTSLVSWIFAWCSSATCFTIDRPRPVPPV